MAALFRTHAERVVEKLGLLRREDVDKLIYDESNLSNIVALAKAALAEVNLIKGPELNTDLVPGTQLPGQVERRREELADTVQDDLSVTASEDSQMVSVAFTSLDPVFAAEIVNTVVNSYIELGLEARLDRVRRTSTWLMERIDDLRKKVAESENQLQVSRKKRALWARKAWSRSRPPNLSS
ncbi:MAG: hypothetical protein MAG794_01317 [Gammaproteobacteria bacterium]|nr:hypothetical protein [Gammaproteobacteria bacterium]